MEDIYRILTLHTLIPHLISVFEVLVATVEVFLTPKLNSPFCLSHDREVHSIRFNLGGPAPNGRRDGESNGTTLDLVFTTAPSHGFRGADIP